MSKEPYNKWIMDLIKVAVVLFCFIPAILFYATSKNTMLVTTSYDIMWIGFFIAFLFTMLWLIAKQIIKPSKKKVKG